MYSLAQVYCIFKHILPFFISIQLLVDPIFFFSFGYYYVHILFIYSSYIAHIALLLKCRRTTAQHNILCWWWIACFHVKWCELVYTHSLLPFLFLMGLKWREPTSHTARNKLNWSAFFHTLKSSGLRRCI